MPTLPSLLIIGGGGHGKVVADMVEEEGKFAITGFIDDAKTGTIYGIPVIGTTKDFGAMKIKLAVVAVGNGKARKDLHAALKKAGFTLVKVIHPSAQIARGATLGEGTVVMPAAVVGPDTRIGEGCIVNTSASVDHDCVIGNFTHIAPGAHFAGGVTVGAMSHVGIGASVKEGVVIGSEVTIGAGAAVIDDIPDGTTAYGVPAKPA